MGRRSQHTADELRDLILVATRRCVEVDGIDQPSAREIARAIGYAPGTLYNMFANLSDILLRVEARILEELHQELVKSTESVPDSDTIQAYVEAYVKFAFDNKRSWALLCKHQPVLKTPTPTCYVEALQSIVVVMENALERCYPTLETQASKALAKQIWMSLHGVVQIAMTQKIGSSSWQQAMRAASDVVEGLLAVNKQMLAPVPMLRRAGGRGQSATPAE